MTQLEAGLIMLGAMVLALGLAFWGWRHKRNRYSHLIGSIQTALPSGEALTRVRALYVATTLADEPLERVAIGPLAYRAKAQLSLYREGLVVSIPGENAFLIPAASGVEAGRATWTIDRVVEPGGLVLIRWKLGETSVDSYFRLVDSDMDCLLSMVNGLQKGRV